MPERYEAVVVGGGIVGTSTAYHLAREGVETLLVDRRDEGRATSAGAGIVAPATSSHRHSDVWFDLAVEAAEYYPALVDALAADGEADPGYARTGLLNVAVADDEVPAFEETRELTVERAERVGHPEPGSVAEVTPERARELFPPLVAVTRALYYEDAARVDGQRFEAALVGAGEANGLETRAGDVQRIEVAQGSVAGVVVDGDRVETERVVVAGGAWSRRFAEHLDVDVPVEPQRGQIVHLDLGETDTADWPLVSAYRRKYLVPWPGGRLAVGATREDGAGFEPRTTVAGLRELFDETVRVAPGLGDAGVAETRVGLRPVSRDGLPVLGRVSGAEGLFLATGHGPTGLTVGPYSGKLVAQAVADGSPERDLRPYEVGRFEEGGE